MIRKQIYLTDEMNRSLIKLAESRGVPQAEIIREGLVQYLEGSQSHEALWEKLKQKMLESTYTDLNWNRSELYEERLNPKERAADE